LPLVQDSVSKKKGMRNGGAKLASLTGQTDPRNSAAGAKRIVAAAAGCGSDAP
jgi:hypothetical protein